MKPSVKPSSTQKFGEQVRPDRILHFVRGFIYLTATVLGLVGLFLLYTAWATRNTGDRWLDWRDPLLGVGNRTMLAFGAMLHLGVSGYLFAARDLLGRTLAALWLGLNHLIYYAGVVMMEPTTLTYTEQFLGWRLGLAPTAVDMRWRFFQAYLIIASIVFLILIWRRSRRLGNETWFKHWQETRSKPKERPITPKKPEMAGDYTKNACSHCGGKIAFPLSRIGESIACPHCASLITLRQPPKCMT